MWIHECRRQFGDRLINAEDKQWFDDLLANELNTQMGIQWKDVMTFDQLICGDFMIAGADNKVYEQIKDLSQLAPVVEEYLSEYNQDSKQPMHLVMFMDAVQHVSRISRVLRQPTGNALLLGVGGSGRQSLCKLATFMADYEVFQVEIAKGFGPTEWHEALKTCLMLAGRV